MNKRYIAYLLIIAGLLDIIIWFIDGWGWTNYLMGDNIITRYGWALLISGGFYLLRVENAKDEAEVDDVDLNDGETIIHKQIGNVSIITITNQRIRFRGIAMDDVRSSSKNVPEEDSIDYILSDVASVRAVKSNDVAKFKIGKVLAVKWGIQLTKKDDQIVNLPINKQELVAKHIEKLLNK